LKKTRKNSKYAWYNPSNTVKSKEMPRQIVINRCYGGFSLSELAKNKYKEATKDITRGAHWFADQDIRRDDPILIGIIKELGLKNAGGTFAKLEIIEIPDDVPYDGWTIQDYDGVEWVAEKHRTWNGVSYPNDTECRGVE
jgi:hypothetical protein